MPHLGPSPASRRRAQVERRSARTGARRLVSSTLVVLLAVGAIALTLAFKRSGERAITATGHLHEAMAELRMQDAWEWRGISGRVPPLAVQAELDSSVARFEALVGQAQWKGLAADRAAEVLNAQAVYHGAVHQELALLLVGREAEAEELDEREVDPAFATAIDELDQAEQRLADRAARARALGDVGVLVTLGVALGAIALVSRRVLRQEIQHREEHRAATRYRALVDQSSDLVLVCDREGKLSYLSPSARRFVTEDLGLDPATTVFPDLVHPDDRARVSHLLRKTTPQAEASTRVQVRLGCRVGCRVVELLVRDLTDDPAITGIVLTGRDITERLALERQMVRQASYDPLTNLPNRLQLTTDLGRALVEAATDGVTGLLLIDLDRFREINDTLGHPLGDEVLTLVGPRLAATLRKGDTVARLGGDEFAVLLPNVGDAANALAIAASLRESLQAPFHVHGLDLNVEASIGVVVSGEHGEDGATLLQHADVAMYVAKRQNLGVSAYDPQSDTHSPERLTLLGELRQALDRGQLELRYQPQVDLSTGRISGVEALLRWNHPTRGLLSPDTFIPLAEHTALIGPLTEQVLDLALAQARLWADAGNPTQVSVNLSARNLIDENLDQLVTTLLQRHAVPPALLMLEITESAIMVEPVRAIAILHRLHDLGVRISIDDFGAGYTSLAQLKNLPVDELKVDRSFVMTMGEDHSNQLIVHSVVALGHNLGLTTVAEGVENADALHQLTGYGCDLAQGYHLSRPLTAAAFDRWRAERQASSPAADPSELKAPPPPVPAPRRVPEPGQESRADRPTLPE